MHHLIDVDTGEVVMESMDKDLLFDVAFMVKERDNTRNLWVIEGVNND